MAGSDNFDSVMSNDVFPIPASPFEEYFLRDSRLGYNMTMPLLFMFRGGVDLCALEKAFNTAVLHEPLFCAVVRRRNNRYCWTHAPESPRLITETDGEILDPSASEGIEQIATLDITKTAGVHCRYIPMTDGFALRLHVHHAVCDGLGTILFLGNWMAEYARLVGDDTDFTVTHPLPERITSRTELHIEFPHPLSGWTITKSFLRELRHWFCRPVCRLTPQNGIDTGSETAKCGDPVLLWKTITNADTIRLRRKARTFGVSLNSYLTGLYFQHLCDWLDVKRKSERHWVRLLIPTNLRKPIHCDIPASNMLGYAFLDRRASECVDSEFFYQAIDGDIDITKKWSMGAMFITGVDMVRRIPFAFPMILSSKNCLATSVFSNIGNPCKMLPYQRFRDSGTIEAGGAKLHRIIGAPPVRPNTPFCSGVIQQNDGTTLSMIVDTPQFGLENCREFHKKFIDRILESAS